MQLHLATFDDYYHVMLLTANQKHFKVKKIFIKNAFSQIPYPWRRLKSLVYKLNLNKMNADFAQNVVANFIQKSFQILQAKEYEAIIHWMNNGREFIIVDIDQFEQHILPVFFRHRNINSFIRQLNMYGFHKSRKDPSKNIFSHPFFLRGQAHILHQVRRKIKIQKSQQKAQSFMNTSPRCNKNNENQDPIAQASKSSLYLKDSNSVNKTFLRVEKEMAPTKTEIAASLNSLTCLSLKSFGLSIQISPFKGLMEKSQIMDSNPELYLKMHQNIMEPDFHVSQDEDDNASIEDEIEQERRVFENRRSGVSLMQTYNMLDELS